MARIEVECAHCKQKILITQGIWQGDNVGEFFHDWCWDELKGITTLPDSGKRTEFPTGAVRDAMEGKGFPHMVPPIALRAIARRFEDGSRKYQKMNWAKGIPLSRYYDSAMRHLMAWSEGDATEGHLAAALWNLSCAMWTQDQIEKGKLPAELNDLPYWSPPAEVKQSTRSGKDTE